MSIYGYIRVSSKDQNEDRQLYAMQEYGISPGQIYSDKISGKDFNRPAYKRLIKRLRAGDTLVVKSIDRLGRNYEEILEQWRIITKVKEAAIVVLDMPLLDTLQTRDLTGLFIADILLQLHSYIAETERGFIRQRQAEGIAMARAKGVQLGRKRIKRPPEYDEIRGQWICGIINSRQAADLLKVSQGTFLTWSRE